MTTLKELLDFLKDKKNIYIYGSGYYGKKMMKAFLENDIQVSGFMNTKVSDEIVMGYSITTPESVADRTGFLDDIIVVIAVKDNFRPIIDHLFKLGYHSVISVLPCIKNELLSLVGEIHIYNENYLKSFSDMYTYKVSENKKWNYGYILDNRTGDILYRVNQKLPENLSFENVFTPINEIHYNGRTLQEVHELKPINKIPYNPENNVIKKHEDINQFKIFMAFVDSDDVDIDNATMTGVIPVQAGTVLSKDKIACIHDNDGINISEKNKNYCECTVLYWIWKNVHDSEYVGLCHYRRRFELSIESLDYIKDNDVDIVVSVPEINSLSIKEYEIKLFMAEYEWDMMVKFIKMYDESYEESIKKYGESNLFIAFNMSIMKKDVFDEYCKFVFFVAEKIEERYSELGTIRQDRYMGYIMENLLGIFILHNKDKYNIAYGDVKFL